MDEMKKIIGVILSEFSKEEMGNRVTKNNMMALNMQIGMALDGKITIEQPEESKPEKE